MTVHDVYEKLAKDAPQHAVIDLIPPSAFEQKTQGMLAGVPFAIKNNIALEGYRLTCGSRMLENYISPYSATAVTQLISAGAIPVCTANLDEFGMGSTGENSAFGVVENPSVPGYCTGGSSSGCAALVASGCVPLALASDTGGSARLPAAHCGVFGMKPTYGAYSRFGLTAYASSMEQISLIGSNLDWMRKAHICLSREKDPLDATQKGLSPLPERFSFADQKIAVLKTENENLHPAVSSALNDAADLIAGAGAEIVPCQPERAHLISPAYYVIACAEASANLARFTGMITGNKWDSLYEKSWEERFSASRSLLGSEVQKRISLGAYVLREGFYQRYYIRAQQYRHLLKEWFAHLFQNHALLLLPTVSAPAFKITEECTDPLSHYRGDMWTACANLADLPAISIPWGKDEIGRPVAIQLIAPEGKDDWLFDAAEELIKAKG